MVYQPSTNTYQGLVFTIPLMRGTASNSVVESFQDELHWRRASW